MAVRDDFTAGEVLSAADLNDTFASKLPYSFGTATPSTTDSGFLWYDSNSTPAVPKYWDGSSFATLAPAPGLELIASETFSSASSVSLNACFTADYQNYKIMLNCTNSGSANVLVRLRASGTDTTSGYIVQAIFAYSSTSGANTPTTGGFLSHFANIAELSVSEMDIWQPQEATHTRYRGSSSSADSTTVTNLRLVGGVMRNATQYDGFSLLPTSGTITGTVRVYGYKD